MHCCTQCPWPCSRPPPTHTSPGDSWTLRQVWVSFLWGHCSFPLGLSKHKVLLVPSKSLFPQSCVSSGGSVVGLIATSPQGGLCHTQVCCTQSPWPCGRPLLTRTSMGDAQTQFWLSLWGLGVHFVPFPDLSSSGNLDESERGEWKSWLNTQHSEN